ncbi:hypothetical protein [Asticcacaulis sp. AC402]|uniref:hypothetical protein n=1 Tax=Asticcacaulis sp. AC402 TaxID=1282361 RepID=UPI0003C3DD5B|nr:hypothetical protein [Asticcacaulis sp. AC402]ESQ75193.1 hypothetical protein ABAC402_11020 [Asticcacaulis sp. AC402]
MTSHAPDNYLNNSDLMEANIQVAPGDVEILPMIHPKHQGVPEASVAKGRDV